MAWWTVDRLEEEFAVCEDDGGRQQLLPLSQLPAGVSEGSLLRPGPDGWILDEKETAVRRRRAATRTHVLFHRRQDSSKGDGNFQPK